MKLNDAGNRQEQEERQHFREMEVGFLNTIMLHYISYLLGAVYYIYKYQIEIGMFS